MTKQEFTAAAVSLRRYWNWEIELDNNGILFDRNPACEMADMVLELLTKGSEDYGFDPIIGMNWVSIWCSASPEQKGFWRAHQWIMIEDAGTLWDFVSEMNELGWPDKVENERFLE